MAYVDIRENTRGTAYRLKYRLDGKEKVVTFTAEPEAREWEAVFNAVGPARGLQMLTDQLDTAAGVMTLAEAGRWHIEHLTGVTPGTRADYLTEFERAIAPAWEGRPITALDRASAARWVNELEAQGVSAKTIKNRHGLLSAIAATAVQEGWLPKNPVYRMPLPKALAPEMVFLSAEQFGALWARHNTYYRPLVSALAGTGLRWGEITALRPKRVDLARNELQVVEAWKRGVTGAGPVLGVPKSPRSRRTVEFSDEVAQALHPLMKERDRDDLLFVNMAGRRVGGGTFHNRHWQPAVTAAVDAGELTDRPRIHDLRHTYASWCLNDGVNLFVLSRLMGHESITTTSNRYGHLDPARRDQAAAATGKQLAAAFESRAEAAADPLDAKALKSAGV